MSREHVLFRCPTEKKQRRLKTFDQQPHWDLVVLGLAVQLLERHLVTSLVEHLAFDDGLWDHLRKLGDEETI